MPNDNAITRLLYAILSQKCLKDINWDKVAHDPILKGEITNGHAARMRYSRFKKQMDASTGTLPPPTPRKPRKNRVEKTKSPKKDKRLGTGGLGVKREDEGDQERGYEVKEEERNGTSKGKERDVLRGVKAEYGNGMREGTGESLLSSAASMAGSRDTPDLEGGINTMASPAVSLAQHDLSSALHHSHASGLSPFSTLAHSTSDTHMGFGFQDTAHIKRERKPSKNTPNASSALYAAQGHPHSPLQLQNALHLELQGGNPAHVTSSVSNSTLPSTPRMCVEETDFAYGFSPARSPHQHLNSHSNSHAYQDLPRQHESLGFARGDEDRDVDEMFHSFGMPASNSGFGSGHALYSPLMSGGEFAFGMGLEGDGYEEFWGQGGGARDEGNGESSGVGGGGGLGAVVKKEERWGEEYRR